MTGVDTPAHLRHRLAARVDGWMGWPSRWRILLPLRKARR